MFVHVFQSFSRVIFYQIKYILHLCKRDDFFSTKHICKEINIKRWITKQIWSRKGRVRVGELDLVTFQLIIHKCIINNNTRRCKRHHQRIVLANEAEHSCFITIMKKKVKYLCQRHKNLKHIQVDDNDDDDIEVENLPSESAKKFKNSMAGPNVKFGLLLKGIW